MTDADLIIETDYVLTMDDNLTVIEHGAVAVKDNKIISAAPVNDISKNYRAKKIIGGSNTVAFPGLINAHTHSPMVYFRGLGDDLPLKIWLENYIWPAENKWLNYEFVRDAAELACIEMLKSGTTMFSDMYLFGEAIAETAKKIGMRAVVGAGVLDFPSSTAQTTDEYFSNAERLINNWNNDALISTAIAPHAPYTCSPDTMRKARDFADRHDILMHLHLSETRWEVSEVLQRYEKTPIELMDSIGVLDGRVVAAHCIWPTDEEIGILARKNVYVAHCIESNMKLAAGIAPVVKMLGAGVKVVLGTDGAASNNDLNMLSEMATAAKVHKAVSLDPTALDARQAMLMATRWGAEALGAGDKTGSLEAGKAADIVIADIRKPHLLPLYDIFSHIVYSFSPADIDTVIINGKPVMENRKLITADEDGILTRASVWGQKINDARG